MKNKNYYIITIGDKKTLVLAETAQEAINNWISQREKERKAEGRLVTFNPKKFSIEVIENTDLILEASE
ncbi:hypothetical protein ACFCVU_04335 [Peribacillus butanolivorans]|uniref:hypothetical protein n=1 Tax=Peribacillus butanolivorans TaxID=421767 RepID=UPI0035E2513B